ncbi:MAG: IclR family transcriptional regulator [Spirochaetota bacterium]
MQIIFSVKKAFDLLKLFTASRPELSLTEISSCMGRHKSSIYRILSTLVLSGFLEKDQGTNKYRLGLIFLELADHVLNRYDIRDQARPYLAELAQKTGEIIHLSILEGADIVYLDKKGLAQPVTVATKIGGRNPAHSSAMGKVLLAGLTQPELEKVLGKKPLKKMTANTITTMPRLVEELEKVRRQGFALDNEEAFPGIRCVAAPLKSKDGVVIAAISATVPIQRMGKQRTGEIRRLIMETARKISEREIGRQFVP